MFGFKQRQSTSVMPAAALDTPGDVNWVADIATFVNRPGTVPVAPLTSASPLRLTTTLHIFEIRSVVNGKFCTNLRAAQGTHRDPTLTVYAAMEQAISSFCEEYGVARWRILGATEVKLAAA